uniref:Uncharacterized protein n=1 Tax=Anguilla anguilla TaxID=7936 RepID=A0A0E9T2G1_ANGAN
MGTRLENIYFITGIRVWSQRLNTKPTFTV